MVGGVQDGQAVNAAVTDAAFIYKNADDTTLAKLGLDDQDGSGVSGTAITNVQREINALWSFLGGLVNQVKTYLPSWATSHFGTSGDTIKQRIEAIDAAYDPAAGDLTRRAGVVAIADAAVSKAVVFSTVWPDANYVVSFTLENTGDANPIFLQGMVTAKTAAGFTVTFNAPTDTANYKMSYEVKGSH